MIIPSHYSPARKRIVKSYILHRNVQSVIRDLEYDGHSFVCQVIHEYKEWLKEQHRLELRQNGAAV